MDTGGTSKPSKKMMVFAIGFTISGFSFVFGPLVYIIVN